MLYLINISTIPKEIKGTVLALTTATTVATITSTAKPTEER